MLLLAQLRHPLEELVLRDITSYPRARVEIRRVLHQKNYLRGREWLLDFVRTLRSGSSF